MLLPAARLLALIASVFEAKLVSDAACEREGRRKPPFLEVRRVRIEPSTSRPAQPATHAPEHGPIVAQLAHLTLQCEGVGQGRAAASHTLASMLISATNYELLPGARPTGSLRVELFATVAGLGPVGKDRRFSPQAATFFFDVLSAALYPPQEWRALLGLSEEHLALSAEQLPGQRCLAEVVQLVGLPLAFERQLHEEVQSLAEPEWGGVGGGVGGGVELGRHATPTCPDPDP